MRTDKGKESWGDLTPFLTTLGIQHGQTPAVTSESNGIAERLNRVVNESTWAMLYRTNLPDEFWDEAVVTAADVCNPLPSSAIGKKKKMIRLIER